MVEDEKRDRARRSQLPPPELKNSPSSFPFSFFPFLFVFSSISPSPVSFFVVNRTFLLFINPSTRLYRAGHILPARPFFATATANCADDLRFLLDPNRILLLLLFCISSHSPIFLAICIPAFLSSRFIFSYFTRSSPSSFPVRIQLRIDCISRILLTAGSRPDVSLAAPKTHQNSPKTLHHHVWRNQLSSRLFTGFFVPRIVRLGPRPPLLLDNSLSFCLH